MSSPSRTEGEASTADPLKHFLVRADYVRRHPRFDAEERRPRLELADRARSVLRAVESSDDLIARLVHVRDLVVAPDWPLHIAPRWPVDAMLEWADSDYRSFGEALGAFTTPHGDARHRFRRFATAARSDGVGQGGHSRADVLLAVGSLFNFALEPESIPMVARTPFRTLEERLGQDPPVVGASSEYQHHLVFAERLYASMRRGGVRARDMLDVQALVVRAAIDELFWQGVTPSSDTEAAKARLEAAEGRRRESAPYLAVCSCLGYDSEYLIEWLEFHRLVGVERFFLYNNGDRDRQRTLLAPYVDEGLIVLYEWPVFPPQMSAGKHCIEHQRRDARWIAFIDTDEFLFSPTLQPLPEVLQAYESWPGVGVNQAAFGPSGHRRKPAGLVIESYDKRMPGRYIKSIVDPVQVADILSPHHFSYRSGAAIDESFHPVWHSMTAFTNFGKFRINHYYTRSEEEFRAKWSRPMPDYGGDREWSEGESVLRLLETHGTKDEAIQAYVPALREALASRPGRPVRPS